MIDTEYQYIQYPRSCIPMDQIKKTLSLVENLPIIQKDS